MSARGFRSSLITASSVLWMAGCQCFHPACPPTETRAYYPRPILGFLRPHPLTPAYPEPCAGCAAVMPAPAPVAVNPVPPAPAPTLSPPVGTSGYSPPPPYDANWHAPITESRREPAAQTQEPPRDPVRLATPENPPLAPQGSRPATGVEPRNVTSLPVGIPQFAMVRDQVATGLKPLVDGGLDWLQANAYRTVLHIKEPGQDDAADRQQVERHGMKYQSLDVSPQTLSPAVVDQFNRIVADSSNYPIFVYDRDGMAAGGLWYLYFRMVERDSDSVARSRAARVGLREGESGPHREMWLALQKLLSTQEK